jgi:hypothetical protein
VILSVFAVMYIARPALFLYNATRRF